MAKVNIVVEVRDEYVTALENKLIGSDSFKLIDFKIVPDTKELYENDPTFRKMANALAKLRRELDEYRLKG